MFIRSGSVGCARHVVTLDAHGDIDDLPAIDGSPGRGDLRPSGRRSYLPDH
jgi:hypothetical protein